MTYEVRPKHRKPNVDYIENKELYRAVCSARFMIVEYGVPRLRAVRKAAQKFRVSAVDVNHYVLQDFARGRARRRRR